VIVTGQVKMQEFISLERRSYLREQEVSQALSSDPGDPVTPLSKSRMGSSFEDKACASGGTFANQPLSFPSFPQLDTRLQMQMEQMLLEEHALEQQKALASGHPEDTSFDQRARRRLLKLVGTPIAYLQVPRGYHPAVLLRAPSVCRAGSSWGLQKGPEPAPCQQRCVLTSTEPPSALEVLSSPQVLGSVLSGVQRRPSSPAREHRHHPC